MDTFIFKPPRHYAWEKGMLILLGLLIWIWCWSVSLSKEIQPVDNEPTTEQNEPNSWKVERGKIYNA